MGWTEKNTGSLKGKLVVITGATGGLGAAACEYILSREGRIQMITRDRAKTEALITRLREQYPGAEISYLLGDLEEIDQVKAVCREIREPDYLVLCAGTYAIPRGLCSAGYDRVFMTNFLSHYYMVKTLLPLLEQRKARVVAVGSIAHRMVTFDPADPDYARHDGAEKIYGNSKRFLMFALGELLGKHPEVGFAIGHPGISFTGITRNYPPKQLKIVKPSMQILFMHPRKAVRSIVLGLYREVPAGSWIGPRFFDIWGNPTVKVLDTCSKEEQQAIFDCAEEMVRKL